MSDIVNDGEQPSTSKQNQSRGFQSHSRDSTYKSHDCKKEPRDQTNAKRRSKTSETQQEFKTSSKQTRNRSASSLSLGRHQIDFTSSFPGSDVVFNVQGKQVHAISAVLKVASREFEELIEQQGSVVDLRTTAIEYEDFCELMAMLHPIAGKTKHISVDNVYRLLPLIRLFNMSALEQDCEEFLVKLPPELKQLAVAAEYTFDNLEHHVINWAATTKSLKELERDQDWGLVNTRHRRYIFEKLVRKYEQDLEHGTTSLPAERVGSESDEQVIQDILDENEKLRRELGQFKTSSETLSNLEKDLEKCRSHNKEIYEKYERYKRTIKDIQDIVNGKKIRAKSLQLNCKSKAMEQHYSGMEDKCATCRSYMVTQIKQLLNES